MRSTRIVIIVKNNTYIHLCPKLEITIEEKNNIYLLSCRDNFPFNVYM